ncbi:SirB1 family protein [Comamonas terrigena]|uniref:SirB1 family protein n=1 Tax=Comamonas terrigena TaxID=32013 RepID=UPI00244BAD3E|nr:tetratricopeptide repeat protein [Comamonas terrigena]MDH0047453.1 tetratricopeptide repeat protein [Comamonas terrigena]MDH0509873.1 tetratricopeptide repeat protein [Comamonas terrigena]MDH1089748.1 tetratricopeptide repeat protein [Comamonas terrigena]MDH1501617.1 tetratricopeptide repeat protein [Comamonas terrigena]
MTLDFGLPTPLEYFETLVRRDEPRLLLEAAISLGQDADPQLDIEDALYQYERTLKLLRDCVPWGANGLQRLTILNQFFYEDLGYAGNHNDFFHPDNSYLHRVMDTRRGIPISLGVLWLELAHGIGLTAHGVSFPGHFLVKVQLKEGIIVQDPLTGQGLSHGQLGERLEPFKQAWGLEQEDMAPLAMYLQPAGHRGILERMLRNLKNIHQQQGDEAQTLAVMNRLITLTPTAWGEYRDRGLVRMERGERRAAMQDLQTYAQHAGAAQDLDMVEEQLAQLRASS